MTFSNKSILVTGGTGSLGQALVKRLLSSNVAKVVVYSRDECKQVDMARCLPDTHSKVRYFLGDVRDYRRLKRAFHGIDFVIHTAALKHVDKGEYDPIEFIKTNINGTVNVIEAALDSNVKKVLGVSSDKAVNPVSLYGSTKLCADKLMINANFYAGKNGTAFSIIRFGNFIGSRGSIIPYLESLASENKPFPITDSSMVRYWITLDSAVDATLRSLSMMEGCETFIPKMEEKGLIDFIRERYPQCKIEIVGRRRGEKLKEELFCEDEKDCMIDNGDLWVIPRSS